MIILGYIDPGSGFVFLQNTSYFWGMILGFLGAFFVFFKFFFRMFKKFIIFFLILGLIILIIGGLLMHKTAVNKKVIILGIDAMDPGITEQLMQEGKLPNLSALRQEGTYSHLATTVPSESAVAWTTFSTGLAPGSHDIFDFIMRNPKTYMPYLSLNEISNAGGKVKVSTRKRAESFWTALSKKGVPCFIYFCPNTFPPERLSGRMLSGMGTPDISGTMGEFTFYTSRPLTAQDKDSRGRVIKINTAEHPISTNIYGPKVASGNSKVDAKIPLKVSISPQEDKVRLQFQGNDIFLGVGEWSDWQEVSFSIGFLKKIYGITRFYLKSITPTFELYLNPINFDPKKPAFPISYPPGYSKKLSDKIGFYHTQGMPHDTWALTENRLDDKAFLEQTDQILDDRERILNEALKNFKTGVLFFYFDTLDLVQHMFWRYIDPKNPLYEENSPYHDAIFRYYEKIDRVVGEVEKTIDKDTILVVMSDHGFGPYRRTVNLNRWLLENGYLFLKDNAVECKQLFENVDWSRTKAYAMGFGGIYINRIGREYYGIVNDSEAAKLKWDIAEKLKNLEDPKTGEKAVNNVYMSEDVFSGPYIKDAPDLLVGFNKGYRVSWQTVLGGVPPQLIEDNKSKWSGDHLIDPALVPGVIFINRKEVLHNPSIKDLAPSVMGLFGITQEDNMQYEPLFGRDGNK